MNFKHTLPKISISNAVNIPKVNEESFSLLNALANDGQNIYRASSGRDGLEKLLSYLKINGLCSKIDIRTASGNSYVSSCVSNVVKNIAEYSINGYSPEADVVLIIHEFGYLAPERVFQNPQSALLIEDYAYSMATFLSESYPRPKSNFRIFSFSKFLPFQSGGAIGSDTKMPFLEMIDSIFLSEIQIKKWAKKQKRNLNYLSKKIILSKGVFFESYFGVPEVAVLKTNLNPSQMNKFKALLNNAGIESTIYFGNNAIIIPCGFSLTEEQLVYIIEVCNEFAEKL